ncbi:hypothetical protein KQH50_01740 [bacterium]|nr:hypothetical protein [bacterium]
MSWVRFLVTLFILVGFLLGGAFFPSVAAQPAVTISMQPPDLSNFPHLSIEFKALDGNRQPLNGLGPDQLTLTENGMDRPVDNLMTRYRGVHFALVVNGNREMDLRDEAGVSRYEKMTAALKPWAEGHTFSGEDQWSLVTHEGILIRNTNNGRDWLSVLDNYQPNFRLLESDLAGLESAIEMMQEEVLPFGTDRTILFITSPALPDQIAQLGAMAQEARSAGIRVNVWMVGDAFYLTNDQGRVLADLATNTGGHFFNYTGLDEIPNPGDLQASLGSVQVATYTSAIAETGTHSLSLTLDLDGVTATGEAQPFYLEVLPPNPMFLSPPAAIERAWIENGEEAALDPAEASFEVLIQFPDGHMRELSASRLLVDGTVVAINRSEPFDSFNWDLATVRESGEHTLQVEVEDMLGLSAATIEMPVQVTIPDPEPPRHFNWQKAGAIGAGGVAGISVIMLLVWVGRQAWQSRQMRALRERVFVTPAEAAHQPAQQPEEEAPVLASLVPAESFLGAADPACLHLRQPTVTISTDPQLPGLHLDGLDHQEVEAKISLREEHFWLQNLDHHDGLWLNYRTVGQAREALRPGDLVHFGNLAFRFTINTDSSSQKVSLSKYEPLI